MPTMTVTESASGAYGGLYGGLIGSVSSAITTANNTIGSPWTTYATVPYQQGGLGTGTSTTFSFPPMDWSPLLADRGFRAAMLHQMRHAFKTPWVCPKCQAVYAPTHPHCERCTIMARLEGQ